MTVQVQVYPSFPFEGTRETMLLSHWAGMTVRDALPRDYQDREVLAHIDGKQVKLEDTLLDGSILHAAIMPQGAGIGVGLSAATALLNIGGVRIAYSLQSLPKVRKRDDDESSVYGYSGIANTRVEGQPMAPIYGKLRYGGQILNEFTVVNNSTGEVTYYALISYGPGPIKAIGNQEVDTPKDDPLIGDELAGVYINGNAFENFDDVRAWVRLGTFEQDPVPGFEEILTLESVDLELDQEEGSGFLIDPEDYNDNGAETQASWTAYASVYDLDSDNFDGARVQIEFPAGLYKLDDEGGLDSRSAYFALRYIELDGGGSPITSGGDNGDGYVYLPPQEVRRKIQERFFWEYGFAYVDPSLVTMTSGLAVDMDGSDDYLQISSPTLPADFTDHFTVAGWFRADSLGDDALFAWNSGTGFSLYAVDSGSSEAYIRLRVRNTGTDIETPDAQGSRFDYTVWNHVAVVYRKDEDGAGTRLIQVYINGVRYLEAASPDYTISGSSMVMGRDHSGGSYWNGAYDDWVMYSRALTSFDVQALYNSGIGQRQVSTDGLCGHWPFQGKTGSEYRDQSVFDNHWTILPTSGDTGAVSGIVRNVTSSGTKRSKFRIEVVRTDRRSDSSRVQEESTWRNALGVLDDQFSYPGQAVLGLISDGTEQNSNAVPTIESDIRGRLVPVWTQESATSPQFDMEWSDNPAWVATDMIRNSSFGAGVYDIAQDLPAFNELAAECGEFIWDNYPTTVAASTGWTDMLYSSDELRIFFANESAIPPQWTPGTYIAFFDTFPTPAGNPGVVLVDLNYDTGDLGKYGFRIKAIEGVVVIVEYPLIQYGAPWADGSFLNFSLGVTISGTLKGVEPRWAFNGAFDTFRGFWDSLRIVLGVGQATPVREGNRIGVSIDNQRSTVAQVSMGSTIVEEGGRSTFEYSFVSKKRQPNRIEIDIQDARDGYTRRPAVYSDPDIENSANAAELRTESREGLGITSLSQALRACQFAVLKAKNVRHRGGYSSGPESLHLQPGDVALVSHDLIPRGVGGRLRGASSTTVVQLDQGVTILPATTYKLKLRDPSTNAFETKAVTSTSGGYNPGADITVDTAFSGLPAKDTEYTFYESGTLLQGEVVSRRTDPKTLISDIEWEEYPSSIYGSSLDTLPTDTISESLTLGGPPPITPRTLPGDVTRISVRDTVVGDAAAGSSVRQVAVSWSPDPTTAEYLAETRVYARPEDGGWTHVATATDREASVTFPVSASFGSKWEVAIQCWSSGGARRKPDNCPRMVFAISARGEAPDPPTGLSAALDGETAVYSWALPSNRRDLRVELRRGGPGSWKLLPVIGISSRGATELRTDDWANAIDNAALEYTDGPTIVARCLGPSGEYSTPVEVQFAPTPIGAEARAASGAFYYSNAWEDFGHGWLFDSTPPAGNPVLTDMVRNADGDLEFTGSSLTARYKAGESTIPAQSATPSRHYIEAILDLEQVHPETIEDFPAYGLDDPRLAHWTLEGPLTAHGSESAGCESQIQWRYVDAPGGAWSSWIDYQPCVANILSAQFRVTFSRPSSDYQVRVKSFRTRITRIPPQRFERSPQRSFLQDRFLRHG